jgi:hypothetical protein
MDSTSVSLLQRLRQPAEAEEWVRFVKLYTPLLFTWALRHPRPYQGRRDHVCRDTVYPTPRAFLLFPVRSERFSG